MIVVDAFGKPPSGILGGNLQWIGEFSECRKSESPIKDEFKGEYCKLKNPFSQNPLNPTVGICVPHHCDNHDIVNLVNFAIDNIPKNVTINGTVYPIPIPPIPHINEYYISCYVEAKIDTSAAVAM